MSDQTFSPVETQIGTLRGRDAIYLDRLEFELQGVLRLTGSINGQLLSKPHDRDIDYRLSFTGVLAFKVIELDSWNYESASSFDEVLNSVWRDELKGKVTLAHKHYLVQTYDDVIEVVCSQFNLVFDSINDS